MLPITCLEKCNICLDNFTNDNLVSCKNKQCTFKMCRSCSNTYLQNNNNCAHCKILLKEKNEYKFKLNLNNFSIIYFIIYIIITYFLGYLITRNFYGIFLVLNIYVGCLLLAAIGCIGLITKSIIKYIIYN